jgi:hypothetical protein
LGNQLFQYAAGWSLANRVGARLLIDVSEIRKDPNRNFELDSFSSCFDYVEESGSRRVLVELSTRHLLAKATAAIQKLERRDQKRLDHSFLHQAIGTDGNRAIYLNGYLQSWKYFDFGDHFESLKLQINNIANPTKWFETQSERFDKIENSVAVHVRRGDFQANPYMGITQGSYYRRALELLERQVGEVTVVLFSDSHEILTSPTLLEGWGNRIIPVFPPAESRAIESLVLMSKCRHIVMANSSFSWWGAWLGDSPEKNVIYPRPWLAGAYVDDRDFALSNWVSVAGFPDEPLA